MEATQDSVGMQPSHTERTASRGHQGQRGPSPGGPLEASPRRWPLEGGRGEWVSKKPAFHLKRGTRDSLLESINVTSLRSTEALLMEGHSVMFLQEHAIPSATNKAGSRGPR